MEDGASGEESTQGPMHIVSTKIIEDVSPRGPRPRVHVKILGRLHRRSLTLTDTWDQSTILAKALKTMASKMAVELTVI